MVRIPLGLALAASVLAGCEATKSRRSPYDSAPEVRAADEIGQSFALSQSEGVVLGIREAALDREFLLKASLVQQTYFPSFNGLASRVVAFQRTGDKLVMLEATQGHTLHSNIPQYNLLASFPITGSEDGVLQIDFARGMNQIFVRGGWYASDFDGRYYQPTWEAAAVADGYLINGSFQGNKLRLTQIAQIQAVKEGTVSETMSVQVHYELEPYRPSQDFVPTETENFDRVGFFEVEPKLQSGGGRDLVYASKWNLGDGPITYAMSANTPEEFRAAISKGVTYWNNVLGKEAFRVVVAEEGMSAPSYDANIIQWVDWHDAGFAYADAQMDPRTGEIKHAHVFLTSAWAVIGKEDAKEFLRQSETESRTAFSMAGLQKPRLCDGLWSNILRSKLAEALADGATDAQIKTITDDILLSVVAHEIGHTLGLRHNFAASLQTEIGESEWDEVFANYVATGLIPPGKRSATSVMDYSDMADSAMLGASIRNDELLAYDVNATNLLYNGEGDLSPNAPLFCTDSHSFEGYIGCELRDSGTDAIGNAASSVAKFIDTLPNLFANSFISYRSPAPGYKVRSLERFSSDSDWLAYLALMAREQSLGAFTSAALDLKTWRSLDTVNFRNIAAVRSSYHASLSENAGLDRLLSPYGENLEEMLNGRFAEIIASPAYRSGEGPGGAYEFSDADITKMRTLVAEALTGFDDAMLKNDFAQLNELTNLSDQPVADKIAIALANKGLSILTKIKSSSAAQIRLVGGQIKDVSIPTYAQNFSVRSTVPASLKNKSPENLAWGVAERKQLKQAFDAHVESIIGAPFDHVDRESLTGDALRWYEETASIRSAFMF